MAHDHTGHNYIGHNYMFVDMRRIIVCRYAAKSYGLQSVKVLQVLTVCGLSPSRLVSHNESSTYAHARVCVLHTKARGRVHVRTFCPSVLTHGQSRFCDPTPHVTSHALQSSHLNEYCSHGLVLQPSSRLMHPGPEQKAGGEVTSLEPACRCVRACVRACMSGVRKQKYLAWIDPSRRRNCVACSNGRGTGGDRLRPGLTCLAVAACAAVLQSSTPACRCVHAGQCTHVWMRAGACMPAV